MRVSIYIILFLGLCFLVFACEKEIDRKGDRTPPIISGIEINWDDTIRVITRDPESVKPKNDTLIIRLNSTKTELSDTIEIITDISTIILGKRVVFTGKFTDDRGNNLSSYRLRLDTVEANKQQEDGLKTMPLSLSKAWSISREDIAEISKEKTLITVDSIVDATTTSKLLHPIREGDYWLKVSCVDLSGNEGKDSILVKLMNRKNFLESIKDRLK